MQLNSVERGVKEISRRLKIRRFIVNNPQDLSLRFYKEKLVTLLVHVGLLFAFFSLISKLIAQNFKSFSMIRRLFDMMHALQLPIVILNNYSKPKTTW